MKFLYYSKVAMIGLFCFVAVSCKKGFLEKKPDKALIVPTTLGDFQALLDDNDNISNVTSALGIILSDDFYTTTSGWQGLSSELERVSYTWPNNTVQPLDVNDWDKPYKLVFYTNVVLEGIGQIVPTEKSKADWEAVKGTALFLRAFAFYHLAQEFAAPYDKSTASGEMGIPLRLSSDVNVQSTRGTLQQTYDQIISDLTEAESLLPVQVNYKSRPTKAAALGMMARVYQTMENYEKAEAFASASLAYNNRLIDYNTLTPSAARPLPAALSNNNDEVLFYARADAYSYFSSTATIVDSTLYRSYEDNDLRKTVFFKDRGNGVFNFKGNYTGTSDVFSGISSSELYLIRAESRARSGSVDSAMSDLNTLLSHRWKSSTFVPFTASSAEEALSVILTERRKELVFRGLRWIDLRRLNKDPRFAVTLTRVINGETYTLPPNDKRYVLLIPENEIVQSGIEQNPR